MNRAIHFVVSGFVIALFVSCASAQTTKPSSSVAEENKMLRDQLKQMEQANRRLETALDQKEAEIAKLQARLATMALLPRPAVPMPFDYGLSLRGTPNIPPNAQQRQFNGQPYYLIPLSDGQKVTFTPAQPALNGLNVQGSGTVKPNLIESKK